MFASFKHQIQQFNKEPQLIEVSSKARDFVLPLIFSVFSRFQWFKLMK
jgi:hypothetical protein